MLSVGPSEKVTKCLNLKTRPDTPFLVPDSCSALQITSETDLSFSESPAMSRKEGMKCWVMVLSLQRR